MLVTSLALLPSFLAGEEMDLLVKLVREQVEMMEDRVREEVIKRMEEQMKKREVLLMKSLEEQLMPRREKRQDHPEKKTPESDNSFYKDLDLAVIGPKKSLEQDQAQTNKSAPNIYIHTDLPTKLTGAINSSEVKLMLEKQKSFLSDVISERQEVMEERLMANSARDKEELATRIDQLEVMMQNISDQGERSEARENNQIEILNAKITTIAKEAKDAFGNIENIKEEVDRMEVKMLNDKVKAEEQLKQNKRALRGELNRAVEMMGEALGKVKELEEEKTLMREELGEKMEESLIPLRGQMKMALKAPPRLASCAFQGAWNSTGIVTYSTLLLDHRWTDGHALHSQIVLVHWTMSKVNLFALRSGNNQGVGQLNLTSGVFTALTSGVFTFSLSGCPSSSSC